MTKNTLRQTPMLLDLQRLAARQPLLGAIRPAKNQCHQSDQLPQSLFIRHVRRFQAKASRLQTTEQSFNAPAPRIIRKRMDTFYKAASKLNLM